MRRSSRQFLHAALASAVAITVLAGCATERERKEEAAKKSAEQQAFETAVDAYIYGYPLVTMTTAVREQVNRMNAEQYFKLMAALMKDNPPAVADAPLVAKLKTIGIVPGQDFDISQLDPVVAKALALALKAGWDKIIGHEKTAVRVANNWGITTKSGGYGTTTYNAL